MHRVGFLHIAAAVALAVCGLTANAAGEHSGSAITWQRDDTAAFADARKQKRFVLLYLEAVWCHWCHVMDERTYGDAAVAEEVRAHYVPLRIDQDLRPDLSNRYKDYGWPATVIFAPDGTEIAKRQGYVPPERFLKLLRAVVADPSPEAAAAVDAGVSATTTSSLRDTVRGELIKRHRNTYDADLGGLTTTQKFLDRDSVEYEIATALRGDTENAARAKKTLDAAHALIDPAWGGVYQYSTDGDWQHPHYEKLALVQAQYLRIYALAYAAWQREEDRSAVASIRRYLDAFLKSPGGAFYVSQDADLKPGEHSAEYFALDDAQRRAQGVPRVDKHLYALQTGQIAEALATWAEFSGDTNALADARKAAEWALRERALDGGGGFRHDARDAAGPYLGDTLAMGRAFLALYRASADRIWLQRANAAAAFIEKNFRASAGYASARSSGPIAAVPLLEENIALSRFANLLARYSGDAHQRDIATHAMRYLADPKIALASITEAGILLADDEIARDPLHFTVVGSRSDADAAVLFAGIQRIPGWYKRAEWWDRSEGALPNADVAYPPVKKAAAFVCTENRCSLPIYAAGRIGEFLAQDAAPTSP